MDNSQRRLKERSQALDTKLIEVMAVWRILHFGGRAKFGTRGVGAFLLAIPLMHEWLRGWIVWPRPCTSIYIPSTSATP